MADGLGAGRCQDHLGRRLGLQGFFIWEHSKGKAAGLFLLSPSLQHPPPVLAQRVFLNTIRPGIWWTLEKVPCG